MLYVFAIHSSAFIQVQQPSSQFISIKKKKEKRKMLASIVKSKEFSLAVAGDVDCWYVLSSLTLCVLHCSSHVFSTRHIFLPAHWLNICKVQDARPALLLQCLYACACIYVCVFTSS